MQRSGALACVRSLISFFTVLPAGAAALDFSCAWLAPYIVAPIIGGIGALAYAATGDRLVAYLALLAATGLHHIDGLADVADAMMVRDRERARRVLEDPRRGAAGALAIAAVIALGAAARVRTPLEYIAAEVFSKALVVVLAAFSRPFKPGLGSAFIHGVRDRWPAAVPALALAACFDWRAFTAALLTSLAAYAALYRHLGGVNGDVLGALLEVARVAYLYP
ncbi:MAG: adenosylcobinamide-GDP ribazoletransferase [Thermoproteaceae archaeon]|nr:adenosylcobinamide-GDP ribazoletransferase [Thermoproteaceae archaeon]